MICLMCLFLLLFCICWVVCSFFCTMPSFSHPHSVCLCPQSCIVLHRSCVTFKELLLMFFDEWTVDDSYAAISILQVAWKWLIVLKVMCWQTGTNCLMGWIIVICFFYLLFIYLVIGITELIRIVYIGHYRSDWKL